MAAVQWTHVPPYSNDHVEKPASYCYDQLSIYSSLLKQVAFRKRMHAMLHTRNVDEATCANCWWSWQELAVQPKLGTQTSPLPVSKQAVKGCGGVPMEKLPKYCRARCQHCCVHACSVTSMYIAARARMVGKPKDWTV